MLHFECPLPPIIDGATLTMIEEPSSHGEICYSVLFTLFHLTVVFFIEIILSLKGEKGLYRRHMWPIIVLPTTNETNNKK